MGYELIYRVGGWGFLTRLTKELGFKPRRLRGLSVIIYPEFRQLEYLEYGATLAQASIWEFIPVVGVMASPIGPR